MDRKKSKLYAAILSKAVRANRPMQNDSPNPFVKLFIALCVVLIANCHEQENISQNSSLDMSSKINIGMSESEVIDLLGSPTNRFTPPDGDWTTLSYPETTRFSGKKKMNHLKTLALRSLPEARKWWQSKE